MFIKSTVLKIITKEWIISIFWLHIYKTATSHSFVTVVPIINVI